MSSEPSAQTRAGPGLGAAGRGSVLCVRLRQELSRLGGRRSGSEDLSVCRIRCFTFTSVFTERPERTPRSLNPSQLLPPLLLGPAPSWAFTALPSAPGGVMCLNFKVNRLSGQECAAPSRDGTPAGPSVAPWPCGHRAPPLPSGGPGRAHTAFVWGWAWLGGRPLLRPGCSLGLNTRLKASFGCPRFGPLGPQSIGALFLPSWLLVFSEPERAFPREAVSQG